MAELPISQDALDVAEATMHALKGKPRSVVIEATIRDFLQVEGFKVERLTPGEAVRNPYCFPEKPYRRLVSEWKAEQGTDTPSTTDTKPTA